jgi:hypothetical protein
MLSGCRYFRRLVAAMLAGVMLANASGCSLWEVTHQPVIHNPFPQLHRVAVAPFFNQSDEPTVDGHEFALAYFAELQATPGFEVVPVNVVEDAIVAHQVDLSNAGEARRLAVILGVDAVVIGSVTDFNPYYPPRCGIRVEWYAANPGFHEIPPGYGLPWGTPEEEFIPQPLVFEAEFALAKAQFATQTPNCPKPPLVPPNRRVISGDALQEPDLFAPRPPSSDSPAESPPRDKDNTEDATESNDDEFGDATDATNDATSQSENDSENTGVTRTAYEEQTSEEELPSGSGTGTMPVPPQSNAGESNDTTGANGATSELPANWPSVNNFIPQSQSACGGVRSPCVPYNGPVMTHTRLYSGSDADFAAALENYFHFRTDARFGGWETYLQRSDDFIRFCCHMHISEMLSARGGADQTRVVWRWSDCR